jgi:hypothetical protein
MLKKCLKNFCSKTRKEEILIYIMTDKYSVKPDKEYHIHHHTIVKLVDNKPTKDVLLYGKNS